MASGEDMYGHERRGPGVLLQQQHQGPQQPHLHAAAAADLFEPLPQHKFLRRRSGCSVRWLRWRCVWGAALLHFCLGSVHTLGNLLPYLTAYMRSQQQTPTISYRDGLDIYAWAMISQGVGGFFGTLVEKKIGTRRSCLFGSGVLSLGLALCGFCAHDHALLLLSFGIVAALGCGLCYPVPLAAALRFSSAKDKARVSGLLFFARGLSVCCLCPLQSLFLMAPERLFPSWMSSSLLQFTSAAATSTSSENLSQRNVEALQDMSGERFITDPMVLARVPYLFFCMAALFAVLQVIGVLLLTEAHTAAAAMAEEAEAAEHQKLLDDERILGGVGGERMGGTTASSLQYYASCSSSCPTAVSSSAMLSAVVLTPHDICSSLSFWLLFCMLFFCWHSLFFLQVMWKTLPLFPEAAAAAAAGDLALSRGGGGTGGVGGGGGDGSSSGGWQLLQLLRRICAVVGLSAAAPAAGGDDSAAAAAADAGDTAAAAALRAAAAPTEAAAAAEAAAAGLLPPAEAAAAPTSSSAGSSSYNFSSPFFSSAAAAASPWSSTGNQWRDVDDLSVSLLGALLAAACCLGRLLWGAIGDGLGYMRSTNFMNAIIIPLLLLLPSYGMHSPSLFAACLLSLNLCYGGIFSLFPSLTSDLFGRKNVGPVFSLLFGARIVAVALASIVIKVLLRYGSVWIVFVFLALCHFFSIVLTFFFHPTDALPYRFPMCAPP